MVLIRQGDEKRTRKDGRMTFYEDSVWGQGREALGRVEQLKKAGNYAFAVKSETPTHIYFTVWRNKSIKKRRYRRGS